MDIYTAVMDTLPLVTFALPHTYVNVLKGWNIFSVPVRGANFIISYRDLRYATGGFTWNGNYVINDTLEVGKGYWLKFSANQTLTLIGDSIMTDTFTVNYRWNLIGSITVPVPTATITSDPPGIITSSFYGYEKGYQVSDTISPGKGYWVKVNQSGKLILTSTGTFNASNNIRIVPSEELPPAPPEEVSSNNPTTPSEFSLGQNYPNPFNPSTVIRYSVASKQYVSLKIYNLLGEKIATLVDEIQDAGYKSVKFDANTLPSGIYFYQLKARQIDGGQAGSFMETKKLLLLR